jgi:hypothetical protein
MPSCLLQNLELPGYDSPIPPSQFRPYLSSWHPTSQRHRFPTSLLGIIFHQQVLRFYYQRGNWLVSPHARPPASSASNAVPSLRIFDYLSCITSISHTSQNLLPAAGLTPLQAGHVGNLIYYCCAALNIKESFKTRPFKSSLLGTSRLFTWLCLLNAPAVLFLSERCPRHASYQLMLLCWSLLHIFNYGCWRLLNGNRHKVSQQFRIPLPYNTGSSPMVGPRPTCLIVSQRY